MCATDTTNYEALRQYVKRITQILLFKANLPADLVDDVSQTAFLRFEKISKEKKQQIASKEAYLKSIVVNVIHDHIKGELSSKGQCVEISDENLLDTRTVMQSENVEFRVLLEEVLNQLSTDERSLLKFLSLDYTGKELAARLGISEPAARKRTVRLRAKLTELLLTRNV